MILCLLLIICFGSLEAETPPSITQFEETIDALPIREGELFTTSLPINLPQDSYPELNVYLQTLIDSRPLPWPYRLESAFASKGHLFIEGRLLQPGTYLLPFGSFWWRGTSYPLPTLAYTALPIDPPTFSPNDLVLPFPDKAPYISDENKHLQQLINDFNLHSGLSALNWQETIRHSLSILCFLLALSPIVIQTLQWIRSRRPSQPPAPQKTSKELLEEIQLLQRLGEAPWNKLLVVLNLEAGTSALTAYELQEYFTTRGKTSFAQAAADIEAHSYRPNNTRFFVPTVRLIENGIEQQQKALIAPSATLTQE